MKYVGSKNRIAKYLAPVIQSYIKPETDGYLEPFVGGANMIDKIVCNNRIGGDANGYQIALLQKLKEGWEPPHEVSEEMYRSIMHHPDDFPDYLVGYVGCQISYGGKWFAGYSRDKTGVRDYPLEAYRNVMRQRENLKGITFVHCDFRAFTVEMVKGYVVYCDIPYRGTTKYAQRKFPYEAFYDWVRMMSGKNVVLVSEYSMPDDFVCIWQYPVKTMLSSTKISGDKGNVRVEKLFRYGKGVVA